MVGVGVDAHEAGYVDVDARFLFGLPYCGLSDVLPNLLRPAGKRPQVVVGAPHEQNPVLVVEHKHRRGYDDGVSRWCVRVVEMLDPGHALACHHPSGHTAREREMTWLKLA